MGRGWFEDMLRPFEERISHLSLQKIFSVFWKTSSLLFGERCIVCFFSDCKFDMPIKSMSWIMEMLITWRAINTPHVASMSNNSYVHTAFRLASTSGVCTKVTFHQTNYPAAFACNKMSNIKCFSRDSTLKIWCWDYLFATKGLLC